MRIINKIFFLVSSYISNVISNFRNIKLTYIVENGNWIVTNIGNSLVDNLNKVNLINARTSCSPRFLDKQIIHYGSVHEYFKFFYKKHLKKPAISIVVSWFHVMPDDPDLKLLLRALPEIDYIHTTCSLTKQELIKHGVPSEKIAIIPLGIYLSKFKPAIQTDKEKLKEKLKIPTNKIIIGSFQKDGEGWGEGNIPKLVKGPDIFVEVAQRLAKTYDIHVLLTGPARGYIKNELQKNNVSFSHKYLKNIYDIVEYYNVLDIYLITSRLEGGPKSIIESLACGVPLISTKVGMAEATLSGVYSEMLCNVENIDELVKKSEKVLEDKQFKNNIISEGLKIVKRYTWPIIAKEYYTKIYNKLLK